MGARRIFTAAARYLLQSDDDHRVELKAFLLGLGVFLLILLYRRLRHTSHDDSSRIPSGFYGWSLGLLLPSWIYHCMVKRLYFHEVLIVWGKLFPGIFSLGAGTVRIVVIDKWEILREAWKHPDLNDRAPNNLRDMLLRGKGGLNVLKIIRYLKYRTYLQKRKTILN